MKILNDVSMKNYTTYKAGGIVRTMYFPENEIELIDLLKKLKKENIKYFIIGNGSNIIVDDNYFDGAIINLKRLNKYNIKDNEVYCECGVMLPLIANMTIKSSLKGLESLISIPGTIGGSIYNNAGAYNAEGKTIGGAKVSDKHANFIINENNATSNDIKNLIKLIHEQVLNNYNIDLILEQEIITWE